MADLVTLTIDGRTVQVEPNTLLVEAAARVGILIPVYCYHPKLAPVGACRMCLVEVEGAPKLIASCTTPVREGMVVTTNNARVEKARQGMLEFLLIHHPLDCPVCDKGGECPLQDFTYEFGPSRSRFRYPKRHWEKPLQIGQNILLDRERCIMCFRCVRFCEEISDHKEIGVFKRGNAQMIGTVPGVPFNSQFSGNTIELCPVGALTGAPNRFFGRPWEVAHTPSICTGCAAGCNVRVDTRALSTVVRLWSRPNAETDDGWLCDPGRFGFGYVNENRLEDPQVRSGDKLADTNWQRATATAGAILSEHAKAGTLGVLVSPRLTNEELWAISRFSKDVLGCDNIDHQTQDFPPEAVSLHRFVHGAGFRPGVLSDIDGAERIITIGVDLTTDQPVTELRVKKAIFQRRARLTVVHSAATELDKYAETTIPYSPGGQAEAIASLSKDSALAAPAKTVVIIGWRLMEAANIPEMGEALRGLCRTLGGEAPCIVIFQHCNSRGAIELGVSPGGGLSGRQILEAARDGRIKALWLVGEEPLADASPELVKAALEKVEALVFQGWRLPEFPRLPDVVLAASTFAEQDGTLTNTDGRIQRVFTAIRPRGRSRTGWEIVSDLAKACGKPLGLGSADAISADITQAVSAFAGLKWGRLGALGVQTPLETVKDALIAGAPARDG